MPPLHTQDPYRPERIHVRDFPTPSFWYVLKGLWYTSWFTKRADRELYDFATTIEPMVHHDLVYYRTED